MKEKEIKHIGLVGATIGNSMLALEAKKRGIKTTLLDPQIESAAANFADDHIVAEISYLAVDKLALRVDSIIFGRNYYMDIPKELKTKFISYPSIETMRFLQNKYNWLEEVEALDIPVPAYFYQDNMESNFEEMEEFPFPFKFYQFFPDKCIKAEVNEEKEMENFLNQLDEQADSWLAIEQEDYPQIISVSGIIGEDGKTIVYEPSSERIENNQIILNVPAAISKTMMARLTRYTKKILKEIGNAGLYTCIYGIKSNKRVFLIDITPALDEHTIGTAHSDTFSIYEQFLQLITRKPLLGREQLYPVTTYKILLEEENALVKTMDTPYHIYHLEEDESIIVVPHRT